MPKMPSVFMEITKPRPGDTFKHMAEAPIVRALEELTKEAHDHISQSYSWWEQQDVPRWKYETKISARKMERVMHTSSTPYLWVTGGTKVGWAVFKTNYWPSTSPGIIGRTGEGGKPVRTSRQPKPGVIARNFEDVVVDRIKPKMPEIVMRHVTRGARRGFWGLQKRVRARIL